MASFVGGETLEEYLLLLFESAVLLPGLIFRLSALEILKNITLKLLLQRCVCVALCTGIEDEEEYDDDDDGVDDDVGDAEKW